MEILKKMFEVLVISKIIEDINNRIIDIKPRIKRLSKLKEYEIISEIENFELEDLIYIKEAYIKEKQEFEKKIKDIKEN